jgi:peptidoglycan DL-endopeptidase CwlO
MKESRDKMIIKVSVLWTTIMLGIGSIFAQPIVNAEENTNIDKVEEKRSEIQSDIMETDVELFQVQDELTKLNEQIKRVDQAIKDNNQMITETEEKVKISQTEILELEKEISLINQKVVKRNEILKKRALSFQENGGKIGYLEVLLGSINFGDFISRVGAVASLVEADKDLIEQHQDDKLEVEKKQTLVKNKLSELKSMKTELEGMQAQILEQKMQNDLLKEELKRREQEKISEKVSLQLQDHLLVFNNGYENFDPNTILDESLAKTNKTIHDILTAGFKYIGNSVYVFGGGRNEYDIANGRFDCSAFVHWAFAQAGISIGVSTESLKNNGTPVDISQMQPGDLVFFDTYKKDGHVGIYLGGGKFLGSQSSTGVAIADMTSDYWKQTFNGRVNRIITQ